MTSRTPRRRRSPSSSAHRQVSPTEVIEATIERIETRDRSLNAVVFKGYDEARDRARAATDAVMCRRRLGPLHGVPTLMKDLFDFKPGWRSTFGGVRALADTVIDASCPYVERMERAGAIVVGKTNSPVMGFRGTCDNGLFGPTRNPFDTALNAGGSSGGSAAAVADGFVAVAEGTDAGGSIRIPAAWCGAVRPEAIVGTRPGRHPPERASPARTRSWPRARSPGPSRTRRSRSSHSPASMPAIRTAWRASRTSSDPSAGICVGVRIAYSPDFGVYPSTRGSRRSSQPPRGRSRRPARSSRRSRSRSRSTSAS